MVVLITEWATAVMSRMGYPGLFLLMALESMVAPVPSEAVMPFAGFLVADGKFSWTAAILASSAGTVFGSWVSYAMGRWGGRPFVIRFGRYLLLDHEHLDSTHRWFEKRGELTIFVARFIPVVRHLISIPAGVAEMSPLRFTVYTLAGGTIWNTLLLVAGHRLRGRWDVIVQYSHQLDYVVVAALGLGAAWWIRRQLRRRRAVGR